MWVDSEGIAHTVALPEPEQVMTDDFRIGLDALVARDRAAVEDVLAQVKQRVFDALPSDASHDWPVEQAAPKGLLDQPVHEVTDLEAVLAAVDVRWRLDAVMAVEDYID
jgi:hypothetical protein